MARRRTVLERASATMFGALAVTLLARHLSVADAAAVAVTCATHPCLMGLYCFY